MQPPSQPEASNNSRSQAWGLARWTAKMDNNIVSALMRAVKGLLPYAETERNNLADVMDRHGDESSQHEHTRADDAITYAKAVLEVADATSGLNLQVLERMHGLELPSWVFFSPYRASQGIPCYWSAAGEWVEFSQTTAVVVRAGLKVPPDGVWIPYKTAAENTCFQASVRAPEGDSSEHFVWAPTPNRARALLTARFDAEHQVTILRALA